MLFRSKAVAKTTTKKVTAKTAAKPATKAASKPKVAAVKKTANKATSKVVSKAGKPIAKPAQKKPSKATVAASKTAAKSVSKASAKPAVTPKAPVKKASVTSRKSEPKIVAKKAAAPAKSAAPVKAATAAKSASKSVAKSASKSAAATPSKAAAKTDHKILSVKQTTDAAALAAIDTSGYILPGIKVPGRRGRKPRDFQPENEEIAALNAVERAELKAADKARARDRKAKEKQFLKDAFSSDSEASEEELERRRQKLKTLIKLGKDRGFLTHSEINDHLPENIVDPEAIEGIISTFNDMGIAVYEQAPDAEALLLSDNVATVANDDDADAAAEAALQTVDSDFGRTTDPVRMYMREMGSVELLTREGEIEIAKRIESGLKDMIQAISACPMTISEILAMADRIGKDEIGRAHV